jgi:serine phosphatase RsbU (regulator of sigma subunit)
MATLNLPPPLRLEPVGGTPGETIMLSPESPKVLGRQSTCDVVLTDSAVSRRHALVTFSAGSWLVSDQNSRHGTFVNSIRLKAGDSAPVHDGDVLRLGPFAYRVGGPSAGTFLNPDDDHSSTIVRVQRIPQHELSLRAQARLDLLVDCSASIAAATSERELARAVLDALLSATGYPRAAFFRPGSGGVGGPIELLALRTAADKDRKASTGERKSGERNPPSLTESQYQLAEAFGAGDKPSFSRSLIQAASEGQIARLDEQAASRDYGQSIMSLGIQAALCAPVMIDATVAAFLYLDARTPDMGGRSADSIQADAPAFTQAVARISGLALANLKRRELADRQDKLESDLNAARQAQRLIMPAPVGEFGPVKYALRSRPGRFVAGDLFDVVMLPSGKVAMFLGDVSGKGMEAAMLMATAQAHLNASLRFAPDAGAALTELNRHLAGRITEGRFVTLWLGLLDVETGELSFVDAGHGHWLVRFPGQPAARLASEGGVPVGVDPEAVYTSEKIVLPPGARLVLYSDGLVEQRSSEGKQFGLEAMLAALAQSGSPQTDVAALIGALLNFASDAAEGGVRPDLEAVQLADDVTVASLAYVP